MVLLIGNYPPDRQQSMLRFSSMMLEGLGAAGVPAELLQPEPVLGGAGSFAAKWLGYIDKFLLFPRRLRRKLRENVSLVHVCDHSNAMYARHVRNAPVLVTCHDLLAVRGGLGEQTDTPASVTGKVLQRWILRGLRAADAVACDSEATMADAERLVRRDAKKPKLRVVTLGLSYPYRQLPRDEALGRLASVASLVADDGYVLHVGSNLRRKNREAILRIFARCKDAWSGQLVFAGDPLNDTLRAQAGDLGVAQRVLEVANPSNALLEALYNCAMLLLYPSRFEGFGWPIAEAQACGCPVLASSVPPMTEVAGDGALFHGPDDEDGFARDLLRLTNSEERAHWSARSLRNAERFTRERMITSYLDLYRTLGAEVVKKLLMLLSLFLPWSMRRAFLQKQFGYSIHPTARMGFAWIMPERLIMDAHSSIGTLTICKNIALLHLGEHGIIGRGNWITGFPLGPSPHFASETDRRPELIIGAHAAITHRHLIDCTNRITIGKFTTVAGFQSQMLTHSIDLEQNRQRSAPISIGDYCFIGTNTVFLGGSAIPDYCVVGAKSLVNKAFAETHQLYGGVPARAVQALPHDYAYFQRSAGFVV